MVEQSHKRLTEPNDPFGGVYGSEELSERIVDSFPYPVQVFSTDGTAIRINRATIEALGIKEEEHVGIYNVFCDPIVEKMGIMEQVKEVLTGKTVYLTDLNPSYQDMIEFFDVEVRDIQTIHLDITCFPLFAPDQSVSCFVAVFLLKKTYGGRYEVQRGREYLEAHWQDKYDARKVAKAANLSPDHFSRLFKKHMGITPYRYYINVKIDKILELLKDENVSVTEAFSACGWDYHGHFAKVFKERIGFSPSEYRELSRQR